MKNPYELAGKILQTTNRDKDRGFTSIELYGAAVHEKYGEKPQNRFWLENESGVGEITLYQVFPGIELVYNDMHMAYCNRQQEPAAGVMEINYCREGKKEFLYKNPLKNDTIVVKAATMGAKIEGSLTTVK